MCQFFFASLRFHGVCSARMNAQRCCGTEVDVHCAQRTGATCCAVSGMGNQERYTKLSEALAFNVTLGSSSVSSFLLQKERE